MRIHLVSQYFAGVFAAEIAFRWAERGHEVVVFTADAASGFTADAASGFTAGAASGFTADAASGFTADAASGPADSRLRIVGGIPISYDRTSLAHRLLSRLAFLGAAVRARTAHVQAHGQADVVVSVGGSPEPLYSDPDRPAGHPRFITWLYDLLPDTLLAHLGRSPALRTFEPALRALFARALDASDDIVAISPRMAERVQSRVTSPRVWAIPLWAPAALDAPPLGTPVQEPRPERVATYHGNLGLAYDFETVISAAERLRGAGISFVLGGDGSRRDDLARRITHDNLDHVRLAPPVSPERLRGSMSAGDVHLLPLRAGWDGVSFPSKLFASLAVGRPVVVTGPVDSEAAELVRQAGCGEAIPASPPVLASVLRDLMADDARREAMGRAGRRHYEARFSIARALAAWDQVLGGDAPEVADAAGKS